MFLFDGSHFCEAQHAYTRASLCNLLSITTKLPKKHPQRKVKFCHQFPAKNSPRLGKTEGSASSVLSYLSCVHIEKSLSFKQQQSQKKKEWKTWDESRGMWCDAFGYSCIHSVLFRRKEGRKATRFHSELISGFQMLRFCSQLSPQPPPLRVP